MDMLCKSFDAVGDTFPIASGKQLLSCAVACGRGSVHHYWKSFTKCAGKVLLMVLSCHSNE